KKNAVQLAKRAAARVENEMLRQQSNRESIVRRAADLLPEDVSDESVENDWVAQFFEQCQNVSDSEMQLLWAKILAGEIARTGRFSRRTLHAVNVLDKKDANLFTNYCKFVWTLDQDLRPSFFFSTEVHGGILSPDQMLEIDRIYSSEGITRAGQVHLQALNLVSGAGHFSIKINWTLTEPAIFHYHDRTFAVFDTPERRKVAPQVGPTIVADYLTDIGCELAPIAGGTDHDRYCEMVIDSLKRCQLRVEARSR
ncbi:MAG TPA: DUF2806 domain-containing protein, partial [Planctomycetaceae bacterium]|nr:DUF2806 domain-containing protein [Planctomycetaceae bacterium]